MRAKVFGSRRPGDAAQPEEVLERRLAVGARPHALLLGARVGQLAGGERAPGLDLVEHGLDVVGAAAAPARAARSTSGPSPWTTAAAASGRPGSSDASWAQYSNTSWAWPMRCHRSRGWGPSRENSGISWLRTHTLTESICTRSTRSRTRCTWRRSTRLPCSPMRGSVKPWAARAMRRAWARLSVSGTGIAAEDSERLSASRRTPSSPRTGDQIRRLPAGSDRHWLRGWGRRRRRGPGGPSRRRESSSARASGRTPAAAKAAGSTRPASERRSILRRWPNPARTRANSRSGSASVAGAGRRSIETRAESTLGRGRKTSGPTLPTSRAVRPVADLHRRDAVGRVADVGGQPLARLPLHHHQHPVDGRAPRRAGRAPAAWPRCRAGWPPAPSGRRRPAPAPSRAPGHRPRPPATPRSATTVRSTGQHVAVDLDGGHRGAGVGQGEGERARARPRSRPRGRPARRRPAGRCAAPCWGRRRSSGRGPATATGRAPPAGPPPACG